MKISKNSKQRILNILKQEERDMTSQEIAYKDGIGKEYTQGILLALYREGKVDREKRGNKKIYKLK